MEKHHEAVSEESMQDINTSNLWVVPYGNLMTILMIFFLVLYGYSTIKKGVHMENMMQNIREELAAKINPVLAERILQRQKELYAANRMDEFLESQGLKRFANVNIDQEGLKIVLRNPVLFASGCAQLSPTMIRLLDTVSEVVKELPNDIVVEGHTDSISLRPGSQFDSNWELSAARALSVVEYFVSKGVDPVKLSAIGYGEFRPLFPNDTPEHRAYNRRIEINVINVN